MKQSLSILILSFLFYACNNHKTEIVDPTDSNNNPNDTKETLQIADSVNKEESINDLIDIIGIWKNEKCNLSFKIFKENEQHFYTYKSKEREITDSLSISYVDNSTYLTFEGIEWDEALGELGPEYFEDIPDSLIEPKEPIILPVGIDALYDWEAYNFVIQNSGNAMNYYTKLREGCEKYLYFERIEN